jgi:perosamine synthetase
MSNKRNLPITKPCFDESDFAALRKPLESGWVVQGPNVRKFEESFCGYTGCKYAVATTSCTTALHLGLLAAGVGPGDEVIVPSFTFIATANSVEYCGARPVFCDIDLRTFNIDVTKIEACITERTKAIVPVSLFGLPADLDMVEKICTKHGLFLFEDAACAVGSRIRGKHVGNWGIGAAFSFHPRKAITTGEGGMFVSNDLHLSEKVRLLRDHGASKSDLQRHAEKGGSLLPEFNALGFNYRMTDIQGALGVTQMAKLDRILQGRRDGAAIYHQILSDVPFILLPNSPEGYLHQYQSFVVLLTDREGRLPSRNNTGALNRKRNQMMMALEAKGIAVRQGTHAVHTLGYYRNKYNIKNRDFVNSFMADRLSITLPLYYDFSEADGYFVKEALKECFKRCVA